MNALYQHKKVIKRQLAKALNIQTKVEQDIAFLRHRIELMEKQSSPNRIVLETYENMLNSRIEVLTWLCAGRGEQQPTGSVQNRR